ncbi:hypothetical protein [Bacteroides acidifaciens]|uniref:hypothetical protein n=1 Tax=Bacteroides acidifaciens TaxID=85831 RepID=UPI0023D4FDDA|nr:hypothetical protein [Bacteroides acidifaciens]MDE6823002.1 helix-turn-helix domain-containing protein [Bacteroides acidifaciens]
MGKLINVMRGKFEVLPKEIFTDRRLDFRSKGLLCTIFSLPNGWNFSVKGLMELVTVRDDEGCKMQNYSRGEGREAIENAIKYLERLGYLERIPIKDEKGKFAGYDYKINIPPLPMESEYPITG